MTEITERLRVPLADRYRIERELGAGGMATVYLAEDLKHHRMVAVKVLHAELSAMLGPERFLKEIEITASLQHPHILPLFDSGSADGLLYYVMPYVQGDTLRGRLDRDRQLSIADAVRIASETADALEYAHSRGIVHRDIKPENILLQNGHALVADFGIALAVEQAGGKRMTQTGLSLGTPQYMSPEQAMGERSIDARSDIYALGAVTYEMLTGEPPFTGPTAQAIVAKVMTEKPAGIVARRERVPAHVEDATLTALEKLPADRFATAAQFSEALNAPQATGAQASSRTSAADARLPWWQRHAMPIIGALGAIALAAILASVLAIRQSATKTSTDVNRLGIDLGPGQTLETNAGNGIAWSPDGRYFVYIGAGPSGTDMLFLRSLDSLEALPVAGTDGATSPFFSPDGREIAFMTVSPFALHVIPRNGGEARVVVKDSLSGGAGDWGSDGYIYFDGGTNISRIKADGSGRQVLTSLDRAHNEIGLAWPQVLPNNRAVIFRARSAGQAVGQFSIDAVDLKTFKRKHVVNATMARYVASGHLLYVLADGSLMASRFDLDKLELTGSPILLARGLALGSFGSADFAVSHDGALLYATGGTVASVEPVWVTRDGVAAKVDPSWPDTYASSISLSPDNTRIALSIASAGAVGRTEDIWVKQLPTGPLSRLTSEGEVNTSPSWSPDGTDILYLSSRRGPPALFSQRADGSAPARLLATWSAGLSEGFESPDGQWLILRTELNTPGNGGIYARRTGNDTTITRVVDTRFQEVAPALSPNGKWLAYSSTETGRSEVYVSPFPSVGNGRTQVSTSGGSAPVWGKKGDELFYVNNSGDMMAASIHADATFGVTAQTRLFSTLGFVPSTPHPTYDVSSDDRRFLMLRPSASAEVNGAAARLVLVQNLLPYLRKALP